jgi:hypothetical protein
VGAEKDGKVDIELARMLEEGKSYEAEVRTINQKEVK